MATGSGIGSGRLLEASRGGSGNNRLGGGWGQDCFTGPKCPQAVRDRSRNPARNRVMDVLTNGLGYDFDACADLGFFG